jgi:polygalacturonase
VLFENVTGTVTEEARNYYVLCGSGSCENITFKNTKIVGGGEASTCNMPVTGCPT